ncbi:MAG: radical SAM family heme chaperone HemW [Clostridia bacterium]|nr:radical SAM family heme chaperone HemW [Clostridia bacterium]
MKDCSVYIHISFCARKCAYCDFVSFADAAHQIDEYLAALETEMQTACRSYGGIKASTLFVGGGTPSILETEQLARLFSSIRTFISLDECREFTVECNPGTLTPEKLAVLREYGVNRLSLGVQTFDDRLLRVLGRIHTSREAADTISLAHDMGFHNISVDLMHSLPDQSLDDLQASLETAVSLPIRHLSCYSLIVEEHTPMAVMHARQPQRFPSEDDSLSMQRLCTATLARHGFERYEISNYAQPGFESLHNFTYWRRGDYLGLGLAAHSLMNGERFSNTESLDDYLNGLRRNEVQTLTDDDVYEETVMLGLRTREGVRADILPPKALSRLVRQGLMTVRDGRARVTEDGADVLNAIILELI